MTKTLKTSTHLKTVAIDVDGVLNSYTSGWAEEAAAEEAAAVYVPISRAEGRSA